MERLKTKIINILRWSEKYSKTDMVYLAQGGSWLGLGQIVATGAVFITSVAFANLLSPETYGIYKYVISLANIMLIATLYGMDSAVAQAIARGFDGSLIAGIKVKMKWGLLGTAASLAVAGYYYLQGNLDLTLAFCVVSVLAPFSESLGIYNSLLWGKKMFGVQTRYNVIRKLISVAAIVGILLITKNILFVLVVYFLALAIPAGLFLQRAIKRYLSNREVDPGVVTYGKQLSVMKMIGIVLGELDKILVFYYLGAVDLAIYALAVAPTDQIKGLLKNINALAMPQFSSRTVKEIKKSIWHKVLVLALAVGVLVLLYIVAAPYLFGVFFPKYLASIRYSQILSISLLPIVVAGFLYTILEAQKDKPGIYRYNIYSNIFSIIILFPLIYYFGIWGAIVSRIISRSFTFAISSWLIRKIS